MPSIKIDNYDIFYEERKNSEDVLWNYVGLRFLPNPKTRFHISGGFYKDNGTFPSENYLRIGF